MNKQIEVWKDVPGYEEYYQVSNIGNVKRTRSKNGKPDRELKHLLNVRGYRLVKLCMDGIMRNFLIHRLVAMAFLPNSENKPEVNHINGNPGDNRIENLEWCSRMENMANAVERGAMRSGTDHYFAKITNEDVIQIIELCKQMPIVEVANRFRISSTQISQILSGKARTKASGLSETVSFTKQNNGWNRRMIKVIDEATGEVFPSITKAAKRLNIKRVTLGWQIFNAPHLTTVRVLKTA